MFNFFKKEKKSKEEKPIVIKNHKDTLIDVLGENSFEAKYLQDFFKTEEEIKNGIEGLDYISGLIVQSNLENMNLVKLFDRSMNIDFDYISIPKIMENQSSFEKILSDTDEEVQKIH